MNRETTCCFTGPRPLRLPMNGDENSAEIKALKENLANAITDAYNDGFRFFISGMAEGFDLFAAEAVIKLKESLPGIALVAAFPYSDAIEKHKASTAKRIGNILKKTDFAVAISQKYYSGCEHERNRYMVNNSTRIIGYYNGLSGGTAHCWGYALKNNLETVNLYEKTQ